MRRYWNKFLNWLIPNRRQRILIQMVKADEESGLYDTDELEILYLRLKKIEIDIDLISNAPWIYLYKVNGNLVEVEDWNANYGFTIAWNNHRIRLNDTKEIFRIIRKYR